MKSRTVLGGLVVLFLIVQAFDIFGQSSSVSREFDASAQPSNPGSEDHLRILALSDSGAPLVLKDRREILFTYKSSPVLDTMRRQGYENQLQVAVSGHRQVAVAFGHEQYRYLHAMTRSPEGVYFYYFGYSEGFLERERTLEYRFVVDGVWMEDPRNPQKKRMASGASISLVPLPDPPLFPEQTPILGPAAPGLSGKTVRFILEAQSNLDIYVAGTFNSWDPFLHKMVERWDIPGVYELSIHLPPGTYFYNFSSGGKAILDPRNDRYGTSAQGIVYSRLVVPQ